MHLRTSVSVLSTVSYAQTYVCEERFDQLIAVAHVCKDKGEVVLRCMKEIGAEDDGQRFGRHLVMLFVVSHSEGMVSGRHGCYGGIALVQVLDDALQQVIVRLREPMYDPADSEYPVVKRLEFWRGLT